MEKSSRINLRVSESEKEKWAKAAGDEPLSSWLRRLANEAAGIAIAPLLNQVAEVYGAKPLNPPVKKGWIVTDHAKCQAHAPRGTKCKLCGKTH